MSFTPYRAMNVLIVATEACNLRCKYCLNGKGQYNTTVMNLQTLEKIFDVVFPEYDSIQFVWHGGEPLCAGFDYYEKAIAMQEKYQSKYGTEVLNVMQTNGTLINDKFAEFLVNHHFIMGISFDGITNDSTRGRTEQTLEGIRLLRENGTNRIGAITVVSSDNVNHLKENYDYMMQLELPTDYNSLIGTGGVLDHAELALDDQVFIKREIELFEYWLTDKNCKYMVNPFYSYVKDIIFGSTSVCWHTSCLGRWICVHPDGTIYPCSREYPLGYSYGNIKDINSVDELWESKGFEKLLRSTVERRSKCEEKCDLYEFCQGGCSCNALTEGKIEDNNGFTCRTYYSIFTYVREKIESLLKQDISVIKESINPMVVDLLIKFTAKPNGGNELYEN